MSPQGSILNKTEKRKARKKDKKQETSQLNLNLKSIEPLTETQADFFQTYDEDRPFIALIGSAGTGKSYIACFKALEEVLVKGTRQRIILVRSAVQSREIGFMPGNEKEKTRVYEEPFRNIFYDLLGKDVFDQLIGTKKAEFINTSFARGLTFDDAVIVFDEIQNCTIAELITIITRIGQNTRIVMCGDGLQNDLYRKEKDKSGFYQLIKIIEKMENNDIIEFTNDDIVRSGIVKEFLIALNEIRKDVNLDFDK